MNTTKTAGTNAATEVVREQIRDGYAEIARKGVWSTAEPNAASGCRGGGCCGGVDAAGIALAVGYDESALASLPEGANMGLSCGNPTALASLKPGETVLDLGSGGGFDCFLAGPKVGPSGRVIGVDMTPDMLSKARRNLPGYARSTGLNNVEFRLGEIEHLPVADASVDVVISNCVLNLSIDKPQVWREIARVLKPGGRVAVSDLALRKPLPTEVRQMVEALVGCVSGASLIGDIEQMARQAGLADIEINDKPQYIRAMSNGQDPLYRKIAAALPAGETIADYVTSVDVIARSGRGMCCGTGCC